MKDKALWDRIASHVLDQPRIEEPFSVKLAQAEGWTHDFAQAVIEEYRWFLYLACISDDPVTPSQTIDRAWHMHLTFSRDYWEVLCPKTLGRDLHHEPCSGPKERPRYKRQFKHPMRFTVRSSASSRRPRYGRAMAVRFPMPFMGLA